MDSPSPVNELGWIQPQTVQPHLHRTQGQKSQGDHTGGSHKYAQKSKILHERHIPAFLKSNQHAHNIVDTFDTVSRATPRNTVAWDGIKLLLGTFTLKPSWDIWRSTTSVSWTARLRLGAQTSQSSM